MNLAEFAAAARALAERCEASLALDVARAEAKEVLAAMEIATPVLSGALRRTEHIQSVAGSGTRAVALVGPDIIYDRFRNDGGTITAKDEPARSGRVHASGKPYRHSLAWPGGFAMHVTQKGSHYMERGEEEGCGPANAAGRIVVDEYVRL